MSTDLHTGDSDGRGCHEEEKKSEDENFAGSWYLRRISTVRSAYGVYPIMGSWGTKKQGLTRDEHASCSSSSFASAFLRMEQ